MHVYSDTLTKIKIYSNKGLPIKGHVLINWLIPQNYTLVYAVKICRIQFTNK